MATAREEMSRIMQEQGHEFIMLEEAATRYGAVETPAEGEIYANFLKKNAGRFDGVILSLPNFGDETGAVAALRDANMPILIQAYPDDLDKMAPELRRDAFCGKLSIMDVFCQSGVPFTVLKPHTVSPSSELFAANLDYFDRMCRVVKAAKRMVVGAVGARTSAFKTVRIDELALERNGITMETFDLSDIFARMQGVSEGDASYKDKAETLKKYTNFEACPAEALHKLTQLGVVLDALVEDCKLDAMAVRCWLEMQQQLKISPCVLLSEMNDRLIPVACEVDVGNAVAMHALSRASGKPATCLDWNNNYGDDEDKCILFHCGPVPQSLMTERGRITDHDILINALGEGCGWGCNVGRIAPTPFTFSSMTTDSGRLRFYVGQGTFTEDAIPREYFGCAGVARIDGLQDVLLHVGRGGHRHHVSATPGCVAAPFREAMEYYLGHEVTVPQGIAQSS